MVTRRTQKENKKIFASGLLLFFLCLLLTGCDEHFLSVDCIGSSGFCGPLSPTPNDPALVATAQAIMTSKPLVTDPLSKQDSNHWAVDSACNFHDRAYFVKFSSSSNGTYTCDSNKLKYRDAAIAMDVNLITGDSAGIMFRASPNLYNFYEFMITRGQFLLESFINNTAANTIIPATPSNTIHGFRETNRLMVIAKGDDFQFFINGTFVGEVHDHTIPAAGYVGVSLVYTPSGQASFSNLDIYKD